MSSQNAAGADDPRTATLDDDGSDVTQPMNFLFEWNAGIARFYLHRYQQYWALPFRIQSCRSSDDLGALQVEFARELLDDYRREAVRLSQIVGEAGAPSADTRDTDYAAHLLKAQEDAAAILDQAKAQAERILASAHERSQQPASKPAGTRKRA